MCVAACACGHRGFARTPDGETDADIDAHIIDACRASADLLAYWPFDENTGSVAADVSRNQIAGDLSGNATWTAGQVASGLRFGVDGMVRLRSTSPFSFGGGTGSFTVSYWISVASLPSASNAPRLFELAYCPTPASYIFTRVQLSQNNMYPGLAGYDALGNYAKTEAVDAIQLNQWTHVVHVLDRASKLGSTYINGTLSATDDLSAWTDAIDCSQAVDVANIGGWAGMTQTYFFDGKIDDMRIYGRALTPSEVSALSQLTTTDCPF